MTISLSDGTTTLSLPDDLIWSDQHTWSPVEQRVERSISGALLIDSGLRIVGRPLTLEGSESAAWMPLATVSQLRAWAAVPDKTLNLNLRGSLFAVALRHHDAPAIDVKPVIDYAAPDAQDWFWGTLKLMEI